LDEITARESIAFKPSSYVVKISVDQVQMVFECEKSIILQLIQRKYYAEEFVSPPQQRTWDGLQSASTGANPLHTRGISFDDQLLSSRYSLTSYAAM
jgi:hypothetical protein